jgi:hypothetical protein
MVAMLVLFTVENCVRMNTFSGKKVKQKFIFPKKWLVQNVDAWPEVYVALRAATLIFYTVKKTEVHL